MTPFQEKSSNDAPSVETDGRRADAAACCPPSVCDVTHALLLLECCTVLQLLIHSSFVLVFKVVSFILHWINLCILDYSQVNRTVSCSDSGFLCVFCDSS